MYTTGRKFVFPLLLVICSATLVRAQTPGITLSELRQIVTDSRESVATAHLVYIEECISNEPSHFEKDTISYKISQLQDNGSRQKVDALLTRVGNRAKISLTELRNIGKLLKEHGLPAVQRINFPKLRTWLLQGEYDMEISDNGTVNGPLSMGLFKRPNPNIVFELISLGVIDEKLISADAADVNATLTEIDLDGQSLLRIELSRKGQNGLKRTIDCDPSLGYRFRHIQWHSNGRLIREKIADDYRDVSGVPYPFLYIDRNFDKDGRIRYERKYVMEKVELGVDLSQDDFKVFVPAGIKFVDLAESMTVYKIEQEGYMGIEDALRIGEESGR